MKITHLDAKIILNDVFSKTVQVNFITKKYLDNLSETRQLCYKSINPIEDFNGHFISVHN